MKLLLALLLGATALFPAFAATRSTPPATNRSSNPVQLRVEVDRPVLPARSRETVILKVALDGGVAPRRQRLPVNLALVIDKSGSMSGDKIIRARQAALEAVDRLGPEDVVSLIAYDSEVLTLVPAAPVGDGRRLRNAIREIEANGGTNLHGGVVAGAAEIRRYQEFNYLHRIILLSDGQANVGPSSPAALGQLGAELLGEGISVTTIGLGLGFNEDLMTRLARRSDGNTYFVADSSALPRIFQQELGDVLDVVARRVIVEITFPEGIRPKRWVGREGRLENDRAVVEMNQLYARQEKFALIEVEMETAEVGERVALATATVTYEDDSGRAVGPYRSEATVRFAANEAEILAAANHRVQADYAANHLAEVKDEVVELVDTGRREEAAARMRAVASSLDAMASKYQNDDVRQLAAPAPAEALRLEREGLDNERRKAYRAEAAQTVNQQRAP